MIRIDICIHFVRIALDLEPLLGSSSYPLYDFQDIEGVALSSLSNPSPAFFSFY
jgi:hypothetical protein